VQRAQTHLSRNCKQFETIALRLLFVQSPLGSFFLVHGYRSVPFGVVANLAGDMVTNIVVTNRKP